MPDFISDSFMPIWVACENLLSRVLTQLPPLPQEAGLAWGLGLVLAYGAAHMLYTRWPSLWTNPLLVAGLGLGALVLGVGSWQQNLDLALADFMQAGDWLLLLLGPAIVALALPLYDHLNKIKNFAAPFFFALIAGSVASVGVALVLAWLLAASETTLWLLSTKSITSPMAIQLARVLPSDPLLAGSLVVITGLFGSLVAMRVFRVFNIHSKPAQGLAIGVVAHGIGTSLLWRRDPEAAAFAALALVINGLLTVYLLPVFYILFA